MAVAGEEIVAICKSLLFIHQYVKSYIATRTMGMFGAIPVHRRGGSDDGPGKKETQATN
jgi:hypothetical protein